ncbi:hypothetical protein D3C87_1366520 [compost metagenome]
MDLTRTANRALQIFQWRLLADTAEQSRDAAARLALQIVHPGLVLRDRSAGQQQGAPNPRLPQFVFQCVQGANPGVNAQGVAAAVIVGHHRLPPQG